MISKLKSFTKIYQPEAQLLEKFRACTHPSNYPDAQTNTQGLYPNFNKQNKVPKLLK